MKFGRRFREELLEQGFPQHWVDSAVPYAQLKKVINKVCLELNEYGLDIASLAQMPTVPDEAPQSPGASSRRGSWDGAITFQYDFAGMSSLIWFMMKANLDTRK
jgi:E3 ubiquitin-protein ligase BAH